MVYRACILGGGEIVSVSFSPSFSSNPCRFSRVLGLALANWLQFFQKGVYTV